MRRYFAGRVTGLPPTGYKLYLLFLCLFLSLGAGESVIDQPTSVFNQPKVDSPATDGEGLFERMIIDKIISIESNLKELTQKVENIEKRLSRVERGLVARPAGPPLTSQGGASVSGGPPIPQEPPKKRLKDTVPKEKDIGDGLRVINVDYYGAGDNTLFKAEIENSTTDDIANALFKIEVYGEQNNLLGFESWELQDIKRAWPKKFTLLIYKVDPDLIANYTVKRLR